MSHRLLDDAVVAPLAECLGRCPHVSGAHRLGAAVEGGLRPESDVDIAILPVSRRGIPVEERLRLNADLSQAAGRIVDVGILSLSSLVYAKEAVAHGRLIFTRDQVATAPGFGSVPLLGLPSAPDPLDDPRGPAAALPAPRPEYFRGFRDLLPPLFFLGFLPRPAILLGHGERCSRTAFATVLCLVVDGILTSLKFEA